MDLFLGQVNEPIDPTNITGDQEYKIEEVLGVRYVYSKLFYYIK
jgi:hypothetical protein